jgi:tRNA dimethylallyltransferase
LKNTLLLIVGPTAVGKTAMAISIAQKLQSEIVSFDSRQFYREELSLVPHHFINSHSLTEVVDAGSFERQALLTLQQLFAKHNVVIAVGGSGLYAQALCEGLDSVDLRDDNLRSDLSKKSLHELQLQLQKLDPVYFEQVDQHNPQRLMRAIEVSVLSGVPYSSLRSGAKKIRDFETIKIGLTMPRQLLYDRINLRVDSMISNGLEEEVIALQQFKGTYAMQTVGYSEWQEYFEGKISRSACIDKIKQNSRRYAKRQLTWFRRDQQVQWFDFDNWLGIQDYLDSNLDA